MYAYSYLIFLLVILVKMEFDEQKSQQAYQKQEENTGNTAVGRWTDGRDFHSVGSHTNTHFSIASSATTLFSIFLVNNIN